MSYIHQDNKDKKVQITKFIYYYQKQYVNRGSSGYVYKGYHSLYKKDVAIKRIQVKCPKSKEHLNAEIQALKNIQHQNKVRFYSHHRQNDNTEYIVMQYCSGGTLKEVIQNNKNGICQKTCLMYLKQIVNCMIRVNQEKFFHRDLKPSNILLSHQKIIKIGDFGLAKKIKDGLYNLSSNTIGVGTSVYIAPQVHYAKQYNQKCDIWSIGVILFEMLSGKNPMLQKILQYSYIQIQKNKKQNFKFPQNWHPFFEQVIQRSIVNNPQKRISLKELKQMIDKCYQIVLQQLSNQDQNQNQNVKRDIQLYINYLTQRSTLFSSYFNFFPVFKKHNPGISYYQQQIIRGIVVGILISTFNEILKLMNNNQIHLPDKTIYLNKQSLNTRVQFNKLRDFVQLEILKTRKPYQASIQKIKDALLCKDNQATYKNLFQAFKELKNQYRDAKHKEGRTQFKKQRKWFQNEYRKFFSRYQMKNQNNVQDKNSDYIKIYWIYFKLCNVDKYYPLKQYDKEFNLQQKVNQQYKKGQIKPIKDSIQIQIRSSWKKQQFQ